MRIPFTKGAKQAAQSKDDWDGQKGMLFNYIRQIEVTMEDGINELNTDNLGDLEIATANKTIPLRHSRRKLEDVFKKY